MIFLGNDENSKKEEIKKLHNKLDEAIKLLGVIQQPNDSTIETNETKNLWPNSEERKIYLIACQIFEALTGEKRHVPNVICSMHKTPLGARWIHQDDIEVDTSVEAPPMELVCHGALDKKLEKQIKEKNKREKEKYHKNTLRLKKNTKHQTKKQQD